ncbi:MAG: 50S ribosomal protein L4 [bacterium]|nr:50S ribosomal protein L4 [bacterium]
MADHVAPIYDAFGGSRSEVSLEPDLFGIEPNRDVMHQVVVAQLAAMRSGTAKTKTRAEVRGGGRKPWRQKGLGRARHGSIRSPIWVGGGVAHGPAPRNYTQRTPKKMRALALRSALSARASEGAIKVVSDFDWGAPKTKRAHDLLKAIGADGKALVVLARSEVNAARSFRNLPGVVLANPGHLNTYDVLWSDTIVFSRSALEETTGLPVETVPGPFDVSEDDFVMVDEVPGERGLGGGGA